MTQEFEMWTRPADDCRIVFGHPPSGLPDCSPIWSTNEFRAWCKDRGIPIHPKRRLPRKNWKTSFVEVLEALLVEFKVR